MAKKLWRYVKRFSSDTGTLRTDRQTDGRTDRQTYLLYQYRASVCWRAIKSRPVLCWWRHPVLFTRSVLRYVIAALLSPRRLRDRNAVRFFDFLLAAISNTKSFRSLPSRHANLPEFTSVTSETGSFSPSLAMHGITVIPSGRLRCSLARSYLTAETPAEPNTPDNAV